MNLVSLFFSIIALVISIANATCKNFDECSIEKFILPLIAICTTLVVGVHLMDAWEVRDIKKRLEKLSNLENRVEEHKNKGNVALHLNMALSFVRWKPETALRECWKAFELSIVMDDAVRANTCINCLEIITRDITNEKKSIQYYKDIIKPSNEIANTSLYKVFHKRVEEIIQITNKN